jgi:hypothetical protein
MFIKVDHLTNEISLSLPDKAEEFSDDVKRALMEEFALDSLTSNTITEMNNFVSQWLTEKGIKV